MPFETVTPETANEGELNTPALQGDNPETETIAAVPAEIVEAPVVDEDEEEPEEDDDDFFPEDQGFVLPNPNGVITVETSSGGKSYVNTEVPLTVADVVAKTGLNVMLGAEFYMNGAKLAMTDLVPNGQTLQIVGTVKGGVL
jgi:hypothetical protein